VKIHLKTNQGIKNFTEEEATSIAGTNPDHHVQDLFEAIERKDYPSWTACIQVIVKREGVQACTLRNSI
jgi:catalase